MGIKKEIGRMLPYALKKRIVDLLGRRNLYSQLPLSMPLVMHIDPSNVCNFRCIFCPTADNELLQEVNRPKKIMGLDLFKKIVTDLKDMKSKSGKRIFQIHLYKDGEPLLNKNLPEMISIIKKADVANCISTTSNGSLLDKDWAHKLVNSGLDRIRISIESTSTDGYKVVTSTDTSYETVVENVSYLYNLKKRMGIKLHVIAKITNANLQSEQIAKFRSDFAGIADEVRVDTLMGWSYSEKKDFTLGADVKTSMDGVTILHDRIVCPEPFSKLAINSDGTVSVCCVDWSQGTVVGDTNENCLNEIWDGEKLREFRKLHLSGNRGKIAPCSQCQYIKGFPGSDDLDVYRDKLLLRYS